jgi:hypothetical protein
MLKRMAGRRERVVYLAVIAVQAACLLAVMGQYREQSWMREDQARERVHARLRAQADQNARLCDMLQQAMTERDLNGAMLRDARVRLKFYEARHPELWNESLAALGIAPEHRRR